MILMLIAFAIVPVTIAGSFSYIQSYDRVYKNCKQDLEERMDFCLRTCDFYNKKVVKGELTEQEAISEIATLLAGPVQPGGNRSISQGLGKGKDGYICASNSQGTYVFHPYREGQNIRNITELEVRRILESTTKAESREWDEYKWRNPGEEKYYLKVRTLDYFKPLDLHLSASTTLHEFTYSLRVIKKVIGIAAVATTVVGIGISLIIGHRIAQPFAKLTEASDRIVGGGLSTRWHDNS
jgi:hypothetical protein